MTLPLCKTQPEFTVFSTFSVACRWITPSLKPRVSSDFQYYSLGAGGAASSRVLLPPNDRTPVMDYRESR